MDMEDEENDDVLSGLQEKKPYKVIAPPVGNDAPGSMLAFIIFNLVITCHGVWVHLVLRLSYVSYMLLWRQSNEKWRSFWES